MTSWLASLRQSLPTLPHSTPEPISEGWEIVATHGIPLYPPSLEKTFEARRIRAKISEQGKEESRARLREWTTDDQYCSAENAVDCGLDLDENAPLPHSSPKGGPSTGENAASRDGSKGGLKQVTNQEDDMADSVEYNIVSLGFYEEEHDARYKYFKVCQRAIKSPLNTTLDTIRNTSTEKFWRVHIRHCGGISAGHLVCRTYHDVSRNYPIQILFKLHEEGGGAQKVRRSCLRSAGYYKENEQGGLTWVAERGEEVRVDANDQRKIRDSPWKSLNEELWLELSWSHALEPPSRHWSPDSY